MWMEYFPANTDRARTGAIHAGFVISATQRYEEMKMTTENDLAKTLDNLPEDFNYEDSNALAKAMGVDMSDEGTGADDPQGDTTNEPAAAVPAAAAPAAAPPPAPAAAPAVDSSAPPAAAATEPVQVEGVLTKDGKHTMPYAVLQGARREAILNKQRADQLEEANQQLQAQIEALKSGAPQGESEFTPEQLAQVEADFPQLAPYIKTIKTLTEKVDQLSARPAQGQPDPASQVDKELDAQAQLDAALAARPLLSKYSEQGGVVWSRAIEIDKALMSDPAFAGKTLAERFTETEKRLAEELGIPVPGTPKPTPTTLSAAAIEAAPQSGPSTLSDITGAAPQVHNRDLWDERLPLESLAAAEKLSDEGLMRMAGLSY